MPEKSKLELYSDLVCKRKQCHLCDGLRNPADSELAKFDSNEIGPWSLLHGDLNACLMVIGQDWGDIRYYTRHGGRDDMNNPTTRVLELLLRGVGLDISLAQYTTDNRQVFLTNAILCLKKGGLQSPVEPQWFDNCGSSFLRGQIEIISPRVAVCLGQKAYEAVLKTFGFESGSFREAVESDAGLSLPNGTRLFAVYHCGKRILNTHRPLEMQKHDWLRIAKYLNVDNTINHL